MSGGLRRCEGHSTSTSTLPRSPDFGSTPPPPPRAAGHYIKGPIELIGVASCNYKVNNKLFPLYPLRVTAC